MFDNYASFFTEVDRAADTVSDVAKDKIIEKVDTVEDTIVFSGVDHETFVRTHQGVQF